MSVNVNVHNATDDAIILSMLPIAAQWYTECKIIISPQSSALFTVNCKDLTYARNEIYYTVQMVGDSCSQSRRLTLGASAGSEKNDLKLVRLSFNRYELVPK
jgi:hypothetical protein